MSTMSDFHQFADRPSALESRTADRIAKINTQLRLLWPQYDPDLLTQIQTVPRIRKYIKDAYTQASYGRDHEIIEKEKDLDLLITDIYHEGNLAAGAAPSSARPGKYGNVVALNQHQCKELVRRMYDYRAPLQQVGGKLHGEHGGQYRPYSAIDQGYADFYKRMQEMGKDKQWN